MSEAIQRHQEQLEFWSGSGGEKWAATQCQTDTMLASVLPPLLEVAAPRLGEHVIDIGCGNGATTIAAAEHVGPDGHVLALDVSPQMLDLARRRTAAFPQVTCLLGDATTHAFAPGAADLALSRFGVMFFGDPTAAFANIREGLRPGGRLVFACWRPFPENPWALVPIQAASAHLTMPPRPGPEDPGPFSFGDPARVTRILTSAGFTAPDITPIEIEMVLAPSGGLDVAMAQISLVGPVSRVLVDASETDRTNALAAIRAAIAAYDRDGRVALNGAIWMVGSSARQ